MKIDKGQTHTLTNDLVLNEKLEIYGRLVLDPNKSIKLSVNAIWNFGEIVSQPANKSVTHHIHINKTNESAMNGGGMEPLDSDPGIWNMGAGVMKLKGAYKKSWTTSRGGIVAGAKSVPIMDATGWEIGDEIVFCPTEIPLNGSIDEEILKHQSIQFNKTTKTYSDPYLEKFERRFITSISGHTVFFDQPLKFNHAPVVAEPDLINPQGKTWLPFVQNNTRNVKISGTPTGRGHIFSCSHSHLPDGSMIHNHQQQLFENVEFFELGPRKYDTNLRGGLMDTILGRYVLHFHHGGEGSRGTKISGCAFHDNYSKCFVPHLSYGIEFSENSVYNNLGEMFWVDFQDVTHDLKFRKNLGSAIKWDKIQEGGSGILIPMGDNNEFSDSWLCYANQGDPKGSGAWQWTADNEGVATPFLRCGAMACHCGNWTWQNSGRPHAEVQFEAVNCNFGLSHGAYNNLYMYSKCGFYRSYVLAKASSVSFHHCVFNGLGKMDHLVYAQTSAVGGVNQFGECEFKGYTGVAVELDLFKHNDTHAQPRQVELINCKYAGAKTKFRDAADPVPNTFFRIQDGNAAVRVDRNGSTTIPKFGPDKLGTGDGLKGEYYEGANFEKKLFERIDAAINFDDWAVDLPIQRGIHYKLNDKPFSVRYTGHIEPYYSGSWQFKLNGGSGFRLWVDNKLLIDSPGDKHSNAEFTESSTINLNSGQRYPVKIEVYEPGDRTKGILFYWRNAGTGNRYANVPMTQMYSGVNTTPPPVVPPVIPPVDPIPPVPSNPCTEFKWQDYLDLQPDLRPAGITTEAEAKAHYNKYGIAEKRRANRLCLDPTLSPALPTPVFKNVAISKDFVRNNCAAGSVGDTVKYTVAAGTYSAPTQKEADDLAEKDINANGQAAANRLGKCTPVRKLLMTLKIYDDGTIERS